MNFRGRLYYALVESTYLGGSFPSETLEALTSVLRVDVGQHSKITVRVSHDRHNDVVSVGATIREANPITALERLNAFVDQALMTTGLFDEFDVTGKVLRVAP